METDTYTNYVYSLVEWLFFTHNLPLYMSSTKVEKYLCGYQQPTDLLSVTVYNIKTAISETTERFTFSFITRQTQVPHTDHVGTALWQYVQRWGLGMRTRATSTWSEIGRSALCGHVDSCSSAFIASVAWKQPRFEWCIGPKAQEKECSVCCIQKKEDGYGSGVVPDGHMALLWHGT